MLPTHSPCLSINKSADASDSTICKSLLEGLDIPIEQIQQTLHDVVILFLTSMALNESTHFKKLDIAEIMTRLSEYTAVELPLLSAKVDDKMRLDIILSQLSELLSVSNPARKSISTRIQTKITDFFRKSLLIESEMFTFIHQDPTHLFGELVVPNLLALNKTLNKYPMVKRMAIYIPEDDCGSWNTTHYPSFLLPKDVSLTMRLIPTIKELNQINLKCLEDAIKLDLDVEIQPMLIVCRVGTFVSTEHDDISAILKLNKDYECWIHVEGVDAIFYSLLDITFTRYFDSLNLDLVNWVPNLKLPRLTLFHASPWLLNDALNLKLKKEPWSCSRNSFRILEDTVIATNSSTVEPQSLELFSNDPPLKTLLLFWIWLTFQTPFELKKRLQSIRQSMYVLKSDLSSLENIEVLSSKDKTYRGIMFRYESYIDSSTSDPWKETHDNLATRFIFSKLSCDIPNVAMISLNTKMYILVEVFHNETWLQELPCKISTLLNAIVKSEKEAVLLSKMVDEIPQLKYIHPQHLQSIEGFKPYSVLCLGGLVYTPDVLSLLSKSHPQVLMDLNPFQLKLYEALSDLDISPGRTEDQIPCMILDIPSSFDDLYLLEVLQVIMESAKSLESTIQMDHVTQVIQDRIMRSQKKLYKGNDSIFGYIDSLFSTVESYFDPNQNNQPHSDSFQLELGDQ